MKTALFLLLLLMSIGLTTAVCAAETGVNLARAGHASLVIVTQNGASQPELNAAQELAQALKQVTGATFQVQAVTGDPPTNCILIGPGPITQKLFPALGVDTFKGEQLVIRSSGGRILLAGGRPRGTMYAVYRFLNTQCGVRWWTPWAAHYAHRPTLHIPEINVTETPAFESRDPFWYPAFDPTWAARNLSNSEHAHLDEAHGGAITYDGFVHTFYPMIPPEKYASTHPEYFALINGKRVFENAQLCTTNPEVRDLIVEHIRAQIKANPSANILSVSQNDCFNACQCPICKAIDDAQGSYSGSMLTLVNYVAEKIGKEFPNVAIDTLAYQYTRKAPKDIHPLPNVIVRLCSIECNFGASLSDPSNRKFAADIEDWNRLSKRLYIWDYTTNFAHYVQPHPNWFVLGKNLRFFHEHGARGVFEQGAYQSSGSEMSEMRAWVLAQLLWNPDQDDTHLIREFLDGYYGAAATPIWQYLQLLSSKAKGYYLSCYSPPDAPFLDITTLTHAEQLWQQAEDVVAGNQDLLWRVKQAHLPVRYVFLQRWSQLRLAALKSGIAWPINTSRKAIAAEWLAVATGPGPAGWTPMTLLNEGGLTPAAFIDRFNQDPPDPKPLPHRSSKPAPPTGLTQAQVAAGFDIQDSLATLYREGELAETRADNLASDGLAIWMPGNHTEWAVQFPVRTLPQKLRTGTWSIYASVRADDAGSGGDGSSSAMTMGVYDTKENKGAAQVSASVDTLISGYKTILIGTVTMTPDQYVWLAPAANKRVKAVWVDRIFFVPAPKP